MQGRNWVFTLNNPTAEQKQAIADLCNGDTVTYAVVGREVGASGTPHLQGYIRFNTNQRFRAVRNRIRGAHVERARGTAQQNREYCTKDGDFDEYGELPPGPGRRTDLEDFIKWGEKFNVNTQLRPCMFLFYGMGQRWAR